LAVRAEGSLLVTTLNAPSLYLLDPSVPHAQPVAVCAIPAVTVLLGITETAPDEFALVGGNFSVATGTLAPHSFAIWRVRLHGARYPDFAFGRAEASVSKIADLPDAVLLNGITQASSELALVSDSFRGVIWQVNLDTGASRIVYSDPLLQAPSSNPLGVNGVHVHDGYLYFTNTGQSILARAALGSNGVPHGNASVVAHTLAPTDHFDDFTFDAAGNVYLATQGGNAIERLALASGQGSIIAGCLNCTTTAEPTSAAFGRTRRDQGTLYVATAGGLTAPVDGNITIGGQVLAIDHVLPCQ
jgi:hypothetical protein